MDFPDNDQNSHQDGKEAGDFDLSKLEEGIVDPFVSSDDDEDTDEGVGATGDAWASTTGSSWDFDTVAADDASAQVGGFNPFTDEEDLLGEQPVEASVAKDTGIPQGYYTMNSEDGFMGADDTPYGESGEVAFAPEPQAGDTPDVPHARVFLGSLVAEYEDEEASPIATLTSLDAVEDADGVISIPRAATVAEAKGWGRFFTRNNDSVGAEMFDGEKQREAQAEALAEEERILNDARGKGRKPDVGEEGLAETVVVYGGDIADAPEDATIIPAGYGAETSDLQAAIQQIREEMDAARSTRAKNDGPKIPIQPADQIPAVPEEEVRDAEALRAAGLGSVVTGGVELDSVFGGEELEPVSADDADDADAQSFLTDVVGALDVEDVVSAESSHTAAGTVQTPESNTDPTGSTTSEVVWNPDPAADARGMSGERVDSELVDTVQTPAVESYGDFADVVEVADAGSVSGKPREVEEDTAATEVTEDAITSIFVEELTDTDTVEVASVTPPVAESNKDIHDVSPEVEIGGAPEDVVDEVSVSPQGGAAETVAVAASVEIDDDPLEQVYYDTVREGQQVADTINDEIPDRELARSLDEEVEGENLFRAAVDAGSQEVATLHGVPLATLQPAGAEKADVAPETSDKDVRDIVNDGDSEIGDEVENAEEVPEVEVALEESDDQEISATGLDSVSEERVADSEEQVANVEPKNSDELELSDTESTDDEAVDEGDLQPELVIAAGIGSLVHADEILTFEERGDVVVGQTDADKTATDEAGEAVADTESVVESVLLDTADAGAAMLEAGTSEEFEEGRLPGEAVKQPDTFESVGLRYRELWAARTAGTISTEELRKGLESLTLVVEDVTWMVGAQSGDWYRFDETANEWNKEEPETSRATDDEPDVAADELVEELGESGLDVGDLDDAAWEEEIDEVEFIEEAVGAVEGSDETNSATPDDDTAADSVGADDAETVVTITGVESMEEVPASSADADLNEEHAVQGGDEDSKQMAVTLTIPRAVQEGVPTVTLLQVEAQAKEILRQYVIGELTHDETQRALMGNTIRHKNVIWAIGASTGNWYYHLGDGEFIEGNPFVTH